MKYKKQQIHFRLGLAHIFPSNKQNKRMSHWISCWNVRNRVKDFIDLNVDHMRGLRQSCDHVPGSLERLTAKCEPNFERANIVARIKNGDRFYEPGLPGF